MSDAARPRFQREFAAARNRAKPAASDAAEAAAAGEARGEAVAERPRGRR